MQNYLCYGPTDKPNFRFTFEWQMQNESQTQVLIQREANRQMKSTKHFQIVFCILTLSFQFNKRTTE